jgi:hypothetical protein
MGDLNGWWPSDPVIGKLGNGVLEIFSVGTDGALWHRWQGAPNSAWVEGWHRFPDEFVVFLHREPAIFDPITSRPSVVLSDGRFWVFLRSARGRIMYIRHEPGLGRWSDWKSIGGIVEGGDPVVGNPAAVVTRDNLIHVYARGRNGDLCEKVQQRPGADDWGNWSSWGGLLSGDPCPISISNGPLHQDLVYVRGLNQQIYVRGNVSRQSAVNLTSTHAIEWTALGCPRDSGTLVSGNPVPSGTNVTWRGIDGRYRTKSQTSVPGIYEPHCQNLNFEMAGDPVHCFHGDSGMETFWRAPDGGLMWRFRSAGGSWNGPTRIADELRGQPVVNTSENDRVEIIFRRGVMGELFHIFQMTRYGNFSS